MVGLLPTSIVAAEAGRSSDKQVILAPDKLTPTAKSATVDESPNPVIDVDSSPATVKKWMGSPQQEDIKTNGIHNYHLTVNGNDASDDSDDDRSIRSFRTRSMHSSIDMCVNLDDDLELDDDIETDSRARTSSQKIEYFLEHYLPYLHKRLTYDSVVNTIASFNSFKDADIVRTLLESVVKGSDGSSESALDFVIRSVNDDVYSWQGYFKTEADEKFVFVVHQPEQPPNIEFTPLLPGNRMDSALFEGGELKQEFLDASGQRPGATTPTSTLKFEWDHRLKAWKTGEHKFKATVRYAVRLPLDLKTKLHQQITIGEDRVIDAHYWVAWWRGYLCPTSSDVYLFATENTGLSKSLFLNSRRRKFELIIEREQKSVWTTGIDVPDADQKLTGSMLYTLELENLQPSELMWKVGGNTRVMIPESALLPDIAPMQMHVILSKIRKLGIFLEKFPLTSQEILFINSHAKQFSRSQPSQERSGQEVSNKRESKELDLDGIHTIDECLQVNDYIMLKNSLPQSSSRSLIELFGWASEERSIPDTEEELTTQICLTTGWPRKQIISMLREVNGIKIDRAQFRNHEKLSTFAQMIAISNKLAVDVGILLEWAGPSGTSTKDFGEYDIVAQCIQRLVKSRYDHDEWTKAIRPINNILRENQKNALIAHLLSRRPFIEDNHIEDADGLFEYFLIDVQMTPLVETSRLVQATSAVQLFIQRCFLGLEKGVPPKSLDRKRWNWMNTYRVWEANRKIFLYPENWIEPTLRDNKSEFFKELESELLRKNLSTDLVNTALKNFLYNVNAVSNLVAIGIFVGDKEDKLPVHIFARTRTTPFTYYHNSFSSLDPKLGNWSGWKTMQIEIPYIIGPDPTDPTDPKNPKSPDTQSKNGNCIAPVQFQGRLIVFAAEIMQHVEPNMSTAWSATIKDGKSDKPAPEIYWEVKMSWTEYRDGRWIARQTCPIPYRTKIGVFNPQNIVIIPYVRDTSITVYISASGSTSSSSPPLDTTKSPPLDTTKSLAAWVFDGTQLSNMSIAEASITITTAAGSLLQYSFGVVTAEQKTGTNEFETIPAKKIYSTQALLEAPISGLSISPTTLKDSSAHDNIVKPQKLVFKQSVDGAISIDDADSLIPSPDGASGPSIYLAGSPQPFYNSVVKRLMSASTKDDPYSSVLGELGQIKLPAADAGGAIAKFEQTFGASVTKNETTKYNESGTLYSLYNWELAVHAPMIMIDSLFKSQQYEQALRVCHGIFDPIAAEDGDVQDTSRFWKFVPFKYVARTTIEQAFMDLEARQYK